MRLLLYQFTCWLFSLCLRHQVALKFDQRGDTVCFLCELEKEEKEQRSFEDRMRAAVTARYLAGEK